VGGKPWTKRCGRLSAFLFQLPSQFTLLSKLADLSNLNAFFNNAMKFNYMRVKLGSHPDHGPEIQILAATNEKIALNFPKVGPLKRPDDLVACARYFKDAVVGFGDFDPERLGIQITKPCLRRFCADDGVRDEGDIWTILQNKNCFPAEASVLMRLCNYSGNIKTIARILKAHSHSHSMS
jgi:hypothetical protein